MKISKIKSKIFKTSADARHRPNRQNKRVCNYTYTLRKTCDCDASFLHVLIPLCITQTKLPPRDPKITHIDLVAIVKIKFFDRPPPFSIGLETWSDLKRDVLSVCEEIIKEENEEKRRRNRFAQVIDGDVL